MAFEKIDQKKIDGLELFGAVSPLGIAHFEASFQDEDLLPESAASLVFEKQIHEGRRKRTIFAKVPKDSYRINNKNDVMKALLYEEIVTHAIKNILSIRYYLDRSAKALYIQVIFEKAS